MHPLPKDWAANWTPIERFVHIWVAAGRPPPAAAHTHGRAGRARLCGGGSNVSGIRRDNRQDEINEGLARKPLVDIFLNPKEEENKNYVKEIMN